MSSFDNELEMASAPDEITADEFGCTSVAASESTSSGDIGGGGVNSMSSAGPPTATSLAAALAASIDVMPLAGCIALLSLPSSACCGEPAMLELELDMEEAEESVAFA